MRYGIVLKAFLLIELSCNYGYIFAQDSSCDNCIEYVKIPDSCNAACSNESYGKTFFSIRPQDSNSANRLVRMVNEDHSKYYDRFLWGCDVSFGYQQSFANKSNNLLGSWFLFNDCNCVTVGLPNSTEQFDVDGLQLGLVTTNSLSGGPLGSLCLNPQLGNINTVFNVWFDLNTVLRGMWARTVFSLTREKTTLRMRSSTHNAASGEYASGFNTIACNEAPIAYDSICKAFVGDTAIGDIPPLHYAKFFNGGKSKTALASIRFDIGIDAIRSVDGFLNSSLCFLVPTGNKPDGKYIFEPVIGANNSMQLGLVFSGAYNYLYYSCNSGLDVYVDATMTHLFQAKQTRVLGLKNNGPGSQYLLLKKFDVSVDQVLAGERVANVFAANTKVRANIMIDASVMLHWYRWSGLFVDVGYNLWLRSAEKMSKVVGLRNFAPETYGIKGNLSLSKINDFSGFCIGDVQTSSTTTLAQPAAADATTVTLDTCDIDSTVALHPFACSNKLFTAIGYTRDLHRSNSRFIVSLEGEVEVGQKNRALNQWALNLNIGVSL